MTNNQKENLLKLFLNKPVESPGENVPSYSNVTYYHNNLADRYLPYFEYPFSATPYRILKKGNVSVAFNNQAVTILRYGTNDYLYSYPMALRTGWGLVDLYADESGFYGVNTWNGRVYLDYFEDISQPDENGYCHMNIKMSYDITDMLKEVTGDTNPANSVYNGAIKIHKSPLDRTILNSYLFTKSNILRSSRVSSSSRW